MATNVDPLIGNTTDMGRRASPQIPDLKERTGSSSNIHRSTSTRHSGLWLRRPFEKFARIGNTCFARSTFGPTMCTRSSPPRRSQSVFWMHLRLMPHGGFAEPGSSPKQQVRWFAMAARGICGSLATSEGQSITCSTGKVMICQLSMMKMSEPIPLWGGPRPGPQIEVPRTPFHEKANCQARRGGPLRSTYRGGFGCRGCHTPQRPYRLVPLPLSAWWLSRMHQVSPFTETALLKATLCHWT